MSEDLLFRLVLGCFSIIVTLFLFIVARLMNRIEALESKHQDALDRVHARIDKIIDG